MDKLQMAHEYFMKHVNVDQYKRVDDEELISWSFDYVDAMQAEAEERVNKDRPEVLLTKDKDGKCLHFHHEFGHKKCMDCGEALCEVDWSQAPSDAAAYIKLSVWDIGAWIDDLGSQINDAPSFGFKGSHIVERPNGF